MLITMMKVMRIDDNGDGDDGDDDGAGYGW